MAKRTSSLVPFQHKTFRSLWSAALVSNLGTLVEGVAAAWLMTSIATSHGMVALVQSSTTLPYMIFSLAAGALADNFDRRRIMLTAQLLMVCVSAFLAFLTYAGEMTPWTLLGLTFLIGCGWALHDPSWQASMGDILPREHLPSAVALNGMSYNLMRSIGPAIGGIIVATAGAAFAFLFNVFCYFALIAALLRWKAVRARQALPREAFGSAMAAGFRYVLLSPEGITANTLHMGNSLAIESNMVASRSPTKRSEPRSRSSTPRWRSHDAGISTTALAGMFAAGSRRTPILLDKSAVRHCFDLPAAQGSHSFRFRGELWEFNITT